MPERLWIRAGKIGYASSEFDEQSNSGASFAHTAIVGAEALYVPISVGISGSNTVSGVTYNGVSMTRLVRTTSASDTTADIWYLENPLAGSSYDVAVTLTGVNQWRAAAISVRGHNKAQPYSVTGAATAASGTMTATVPGPGEGLALCVVNLLLGSATGAASITQPVSPDVINIFNSTSYQNQALHSCVLASSSTKNLTFTAPSGTPNWAQSVLTVRPPLTLERRENL